MGPPGAPPPPASRARRGSNEDIKDMARACICKTVRVRTVTVRAVRVRSFRVRLGQSNRARRHKGHGSGVYLQDSRGEDSYGEDS